MIRYLREQCRQSTPKLTSFSFSIVQQLLLDSGDEAERARLYMVGNG